MFKTLCQSLVVALPDPEEEKMPGKPKKDEEEGKFCVISFVQP